MRAYFYWFLLAGVLLALWAQWRLRSAYRRWPGQASAAHEALTDLACVAVGGNGAPAP